MARFYEQLSTGNFIILVFLLYILRFYKKIKRRLSQFLKI